MLVAFSYSVIQPISQKFSAWPLAKQKKIEKFAAFCHNYYFISVDLETTGFLGKHVKF